MSRYRSSVALLVLIGLAAIALPRSTSQASVVRPNVPPGFEIETIAHVESPRELAIAPDGDLFIGTNGDAIELIAHATETPEKPVVFARIPDRVAAGVTLGRDALFVGSFNGVWRVPYRAGDRHARSEPVAIAHVRTGGGRGHETTSVAVSSERLYASVGSSCNACDESDPTRATIQEMALDGTQMHARATHVRNAIALAVDPLTHGLWAGVAGQDELAHGHPFEIFDEITAHAGTPNYGWPDCYEDHRAVATEHDCATQTVARVVFPAYETPIGAAFYRVPPTAAHAFGPAYRDGAFVALHGSWHRPLVAPRVVFVPIARDEPLRPVDWNDPGTQWRPFVDGFQRKDGSRLGRPTGIAVASDGSLFVADDDANAIYRIRPTVSSSRRGGRTERSRVGR